MPKCLNKTTASKFTRLVNCTVTPKDEASHKGVVVNCPERVQKAPRCPLNPQCKSSKREKPTKDKTLLSS